MRLHSLSRLLLLLTALCFAAFTAPAGAEVPDAAGRWQGVVVITPDLHEFDLELSLAKSPEGKWSGTVVTPAFGFEPKPLKSVNVEGNTVTLEEETSYGLRIYKGTISPEGDRIQGIYLRGELGTSSFVLEKQGAQPMLLPPALLDLSSDARELKEMFNRDSGKERLIFILSPTSIAGNIRSRMVQRHVLEKISNPNLRVYLLWIPIRPTDDRKAAEQATVHVSDPRVTHFWTKDLTVPNAFRPVLGVDEVPWDVFLIYAADVRWGDFFPAPSTLSHELDGLPEDKRFNTTKLAEEVRKFLPSSSR